MPGPATRERFRGRLLGPSEGRPDVVIDGPIRSGVGLDEPSEATIPHPRTIRRAIAREGDTDVPPTMAGALSGSRLAIEAVPGEVAAKLEDGRRGRSPILGLADRLHDRHRPH